MSAEYQGLPTRDEIEALENPKNGLELSKSLQNRHSSYHKKMMDALAEERSLSEILQLCLEESLMLQEKADKKREQMLKDDVSASELSLKKLRESTLQMAEAYKVSSHLLERQAAAQNSAAVRLTPAAQLVHLQQQVQAAQQTIQHASQQMAQLNVQYQKVQQQAHAHFVSTVISELQNKKIKLKNTNNVEIEVTKEVLQELEHVFENVPKAPAAPFATRLNRYAPSLRRRLEQEVKQGDYSACSTIVQAENVQAELAALYSLANYYLSKEPMGAAVELEANNSQLTSVLRNNALIFDRFGKAYQMNVPKLAQNGAEQMQYYAIKVDAEATEEQLQNEIEKLAAAHHLKL